jgi:hypothetical protein
LLNQRPTVEQKCHRTPERESMLGRQGHRLLGQIGAGFGVAAQEFEKSRLRECSG